ncbi:TolC family protein [Flavobacterium zepuense]|uniref:TolC family protein n=1 Tax=Flavobacterium zepuense TaxID=2593302 RepID=A0A552V634_9FLAO|nr:TolC family protein [Flavobacterium zepuense]TRW25907.1 TolC family protein [Flavobacterium zepuense]
MNAIKLLALFILLSCHATAQEVWTLKKCLETGLQNKLDFKIKQLDILSADVTQRPALLEYLPTVGFSGTHSYSIGSTIDPATNNRVSSKIQSDNVSLNASMNILDLNIFTVARRNKIAALKARADKEAAESEYTLLVLERYFTAVYTQELLKIQRSQFENAVFNLNRIAKEVEIGSKPKSDLYDMQVSYAQEENNILETTQLLENQKLLLLQLLNVTNTTPNAIVLETVAQLESAPLSDISTYETAVTNNPKVKSALLNEAVLQKNVTIEKNNYLPVLSAFYSYSSFYYQPLNQPGATVNPFWTQLNDNKNHYIGLQLSVPIFNGLKTNRDVQLAKLEYQKGTVVTEQSKLELRQSIEQETTKQQQNTLLVSKLEDTQAFAEKSFNTTQSKFTNGLIEAVVFTASKNQLLTAQYSLLKAKVTSQYLDLKLRFLQYNAL